MSGYNIKSKFIKGTKYILADTLLDLLTLSKLKKDMNMDMLYLYNCQTNIDAMADANIKSEANEEVDIHLPLDKKKCCLICNRKMYFVQMFKVN